MIQLNRNFYSDFSLGLNSKDWKVIQYLTKRFHRTCIIVILVHSPTLKKPLFIDSCVCDVYDHFNPQKNLQPFAFDRHMTKSLLSIVKSNWSNFKARLILIILFSSFKFDLKLHKRHFSIKEFFLYFWLKRFRIQFLSRFYVIAHMKWTCQ
jgi:hypothetical protein